MYPFHIAQQQIRRTYRRTGILLSFQNPKYCFLTHQMMESLNCGLHLLVLSHLFRFVSAYPLPYPFRKACDDRLFIRINRFYVVSSWHYENLLLIYNELDTRGSQKATYITKKYFVIHRSIFYSLNQLSIVHDLFPIQKKIGFQ